MTYAAHVNRASPNKELIICTTHKTAVIRREAEAVWLIDTNISIVPKRGWSYDL